MAKERLLFVSLVAALATGECIKDSPEIAWVRDDTGKMVERIIDPENIFATVSKLLTSSVYDDGSKTILDRVPPYYAFTYPERFTAEDIIHFVLADIAPEEAEQWPEGLPGGLIQVLKIRYRVSVEEAKQYRNSRFSPDELFKLLMERVTFQTANAYSRRFTKDNLLLLAAGAWKIDIQPVAPDLANKFAERFSAYDIAMLVKGGIDPEFAEKYPKRFHGDDILSLIICGIDSDKAAGYPEEKTANDICEELGFDTRGCSRVPNFRGCLMLQASQQRKPSYEYRQGTVVRHEVGNQK